MNNVRFVLLAVCTLLLTSVAMAQLSGTKTIPGDYATLAAAIADLNAQGVGSGGVTFNVAAGYTETAPAGGFVITAQGTAANPIVFQKSGSGADPTFTAPAPQTVGNLNDAIFKLVGADYVTLDRFTMLENAANSVTTAASNDMTEWGVALLSADSTNGAQNNTIKNCTIQLKRIYQNTFGIYSNATHTSTSISTALGGTTPAVSHSGLTIHGNTIDSVNIGIVVVGPTAATAHNDGLDIGGSSAATGNTIIRYGTTGTFSSYLNVSGTVNGILVRNTKNFNISYNTIQSSNGGTTSGTLRGIYVPAFSTAPTGTFTNNINNNSISLRSAVATGAMLGIAVESGTSTITSTTNINDNDFNTTTHTVAASGTITFISHVGSSTAGPLTVNINNNTFTGLSVNTTGSVTFISNSWTGSAGFTKNVNGNQIVGGFAKTGAGGTVTLYTNNGSDPAGSFENNNNNNFSNITVTGATTIAGWSNTNGGAPTKTVSNNTFSNWTGGTSAVTGITINFDGGPTTVSGNTVSNITSGGAITGISFGSTGAGTTNASQNTVHSLTSTGAAAVTGISVAGGTTRTLFKNKIYSLEANNASGTVNGILISGGTTVSVYNNLIGDLRAPVTSSTTDAIRGINISAATASSTRDISYNTIYINATSSGANFSTSGIFHTYSATATSATLNMRNNVIVNTSTPNGTGVTAAFRRSAATDLNNYSTASNNNLFYAGTPGAANLIYTDGTNNDQTLADFKNRVAPREALSVTENPPFLSTTGSSPDFLHMSTSIATQTESGGTPVAGITDDYDGDSRNATTPDIGADEFAGIPADLIPPTITYTPLLNTGSTAARTLTATITDLSGVPTSGIGLPVIYWRINSGAYMGTQGVFVSGNQYSFTFGAGVAAGDTVYYYIAAQDAASPPNVGVQPSAGAGGFTANPPAAATPPTNPSSYLITQPPLSGDYTIGAALFNRITGRNITFEKVVRRVWKEVVEEVPAEKGSEQPSAAHEVSGRKKLVEVEEISWIPMENGKVYEGSLYVSRDDYPNALWPVDGVGDYATITAAIADLNTRGVSGHTRFLLLDAAYPTETFPITINVTNEAKPTASATVTIKPAAGVSSTISGAGQILKVFNTNYITIDGSNTNGGTTRDLTIENTSATSPSGTVWFGSSGTTPITNGTLKNCIVRHGVNTSSAVVISDGLTVGAAGYFSNMTVENNNVQRAYIAVYATGGTSPQNGSNLTYRNNDLTTSGANAIRFTGLYMQGVNGATVSGNVIANFDGTSSEDDRGIWLASGTINATVNANRIHSLNYTGTGGYGAYGIAVSSGATGANNVLSNNVIYNLSGDGWNYTTILGDNPIGIYAFTTQTDVKIYFNSIHLYGNTLNKTSALSMGIALGTGTVADVRDNIVVNNLGLLATTGYGSAGVFLQTEVSQLSISNYNDYVVNPSGSGVKAIGKVAAADYLTLGDWQTATGQDANSISADPLFVSSTDLRPALGSPVLGAGVTIPGITTDFLGAPRGTPPSIGAYENGVITTPPNCALNVSPAPGATLVLPSATLNWAPDPGGPTPAGYKLYFGTVTPAPFVGDLGNVTMYDPPGDMAFNTVHYWKVVPYNAAGDAVGCLEWSFTTGGNPVVSTFPYTEDFEDPPSPPAAPGRKGHEIMVGGYGWTTAATGGVNNWVRGTPAKTQISAAHSGVKAYVTKTTGSYDNNHNAALVSPRFDFSSLTAAPVLDFWHNFLTEAGWDGGVVEYSTDGGATWRRVDSTLGTGATFNTTNSTYWYNNSSTSGPLPPPKYSGTSTAYTGHSAGWIHSTSILVGLEGLPDVRLRWRFASDGSVVNEGWAIDDVSILPGNPMTYSSSTTTQNNTAPVSRGATNQEIIGIQIVTTGIVSPISATRFVLSTGGSTSASDIANARLFYTGTSGTFNTTNQFGATVPTPSGVFAFDGSQQLAEGTNYFWLAYDIALSAGVGNVVDATCDSLYIGTSGYVPSVTAPAGSRTVTAAVIATSPDSLVKTLPPNSTASDTVVIKNTGNAPLVWSISDEETGPSRPIRVVPLKYHLPAAPQPKGAKDEGGGPPVIDGQGGPDAFGYRWIDSDEPGGPTFNWVDISGSAPFLDSASAWVPTGTFGGNDEGYYPVQLPFAFPYYGNLKDSIFIGTNGNVMFERPTANIFTNAPFPTAGGGIDQHIGVFWDDLEVRAGARVYYGLSGSDYVVQYQGMARYAGTVQNYTFEIILKPNGTWITQYDSMGFNGGTLTSATIGMENAGGTIGLTVVHNAAYMHNDLAIKFFLPDAPWLSEDPTSGTVNPGDSVKVAVLYNSTGLVDSMYNAVLKIASNDPATPMKQIPVHMTVQTGGGTVTINVPVAVNWNIVSLPVSNPTSGDSVRQVYVNSSFPYGFAFVPGSGYQQRYIMQNGPGYWVKSTATYTQDITGTPLASLSIPVSAGWNMIGSRSTATDTGCVAWSGGASRVSSFFAYNGGYVIVSSLAPGKGFWIKSGAAGTITLQNCPLGKPQAAPAGRSIEELNSITIRDANGGMQTLYFGVNDEIQVSMYELPPVPPQGAFDARFTSSDGGRMVQTHAAEVSEAIEWPIAIQSSAYPLTVTWKVNGADALYELRAGEDVVQTLTGEGTLRIGSEGLNRLTLRVVGGSALPKEYALWQNYPNPFNPTTNIKFALPVESKVSADVYNILGQRVATLVNEVLPAGYHTMEWNGTGSAGQPVGSGVYFVRLDAKGANGKTFTDVKKLLLLK